MIGSIVQNGVAESIDNTNLDPRGVHISGTSETPMARSCSWHPSWSRIGRSAPWLSGATRMNHRSIRLN